MQASISASRLRHPYHGPLFPYARTTGNSFHRVVRAGDFIRWRIRQRSLSSSVPYRTTGRPDVLTLRRLKKQKLALKDQIVKIEDMMIPDIIA